MARHRRKVKGAPEPSKLSAAARELLVRIADTVKASARSVEGVVVEEGDPPQLGPRRHYDLNDVRRIYRRHFGDD